MDENKMEKNKAKAFFSLYELEPIMNLILKTDGKNYNEKILNYINNLSRNIIISHNRRLGLRETAIYTFPYLSSGDIFIIIVTKANTNHPYLLYLNVNSNEIKVLLPIGGDRKQVDLDIINNFLPICDWTELFMINLLLEKTIFIRKTGILIEKQFTLIDCNNITHCKKKIQEIKKSSMISSEKDEQIKKYTNYYLQKGLDMLTHFFDLLMNNQIDEAKVFLKGDTSGLLKNKQRLNTFFR